MENGIHILMSMGEALIELERQAGEPGQGVVMMTAAMNAEIKRALSSENHGYLESPMGDTKVIIVPGDKLSCCARFVKDSEKEKFTKLLNA